LITIGRSEVKNKKLGVMNTMGDRAGFRCRAQQVFICKGPEDEAGSWSRDRQKVIHRGFKKATVRAEKRLVTSSGR
jgi:hypothetical protein